MSVSQNLIVNIEKHIVEKMVQVIEKCFEILLPDSKFNVTLLICDNEYIKALNNKYRNNDFVTDVLSFPLLDSKKPGEVEHDNLDIDPDTQEVMLGDIVLSYERAVSQAQEYGHSLERELCYLAVHSMLHLVGYNHMKDDDKILMRQKEEEIMNVLGIIR